MDRDGWPFLITEHPRPMTRTHDGGTGSVRTLYGRFRAGALGPFAVVETRKPLSPEGSTAEVWWDKCIPLGLDTTPRERIYTVLEFLLQIGDEEAIATSINQTRGE